MELRGEYLGQQTISTIYFGGGTPSLLQPWEIGALLEQLNTFWTIESGAEITLEANPDDINPGLAESWKAGGINRLSIGVQSFFDDDLRWMNRAHNAGQSRKAVQLAYGAGLNNLSIDLIYGTPTLSDAHWHENVQEALQLAVPHLSCYALTVEPRTALEKQIRMNAIPPIDPAHQARQFDLLMQWMGDAGYLHYEISNFALPGRESRHNSAYWKGVHYLGLGPSAHSFNGISRQWNIANNALYITNIGNGIIPAEKEELTNTQKLNEYVMTALRTVDGIDLKFVQSEFSESVVKKIRERSRRFIVQQLLYENGERLMLTRNGKLFADGIAADLFA